MNMHVACNVKETGPPAALPRKNFTPEETALINSVFDYPEYIRRALQGHKESRRYVACVLHDLVKGIHVNANNKMVIELLARHGDATARKLLPTL